MTRVVALLASALALFAACNEDAPGPRPQTTETGAASVVLHAYNVTLDPDAEPGSNEIGFIVRAARAPLHVVVTGPEVDICPVLPPEGETPPCEHGKEADIDAEGVIVRATDEPAEIEEIAVSYMAADRTTRIELPTIPPRPGESVCKDACNPVFEMTPFSAGGIEATAMWEGIATAKLLVETGGMSENAYTKRGEPYREIASNQAFSEENPAELNVAATVEAEEHGVALENRGARPLLDASIEIDWP